MPRLAALAAPLLALLLGPAGRRFEEITRFPAPEARQAVAVDERHFYAIDNHAVSKRDKETGREVARWAGADGGPVIHLNSGVVLDGKLYMAHSNYPAVPMVSSIEVFDAARLEPVGSHSFGIYEGSATWVDRHDGSWWVAFANYSGRGGQPGRGSGWTTLVRFDDQWRRLAGYTFPPEVVRRFGEMSTSGGTWGPDGLLYITGHDESEVYALRLPRSGSVLELAETIPAPAEGQGIAWDRGRPGVLYTIRRSTREVVVSRLVE